MFLVQWRSMSFEPKRESPISLASGATSKRLEIEYLIRQADGAIAESLGQDVVAGLTQPAKTLPPKYFYDDRGSDLFEQICELPEYYLTRAETAILQTYGQDIADKTGPCQFIELGSGSSTKTRLLLSAYQSLGQPVDYCPIDISAGILEASAQKLLQDYPMLNVHGFVGTYELALHHLATQSHAKRLICFLGSTIGNLSPAEATSFFAQVKAALQPGDYFLLGMDLQKSIPQLEAAYNDRQGITAAFNLNMLRHLNHRFAGNFDLSQFEHWAFYNDVDHQIEMHLRSRCCQTVTLQQLNLTIDLAAGETIRTEVSRKFDRMVMEQQLATYGFIPVYHWTDPNHWFGLLLCQLTDSPNSQ